MAFFSYKALGPDGTKIAGRINSASRTDAVRELRARNISVFEIEALRKGGKNTSRARVSNEDYYRAIDQLGLLSSAGVPILGAVETLAANASKYVLRDQLARIAVELRQGRSLSDAIASHMPSLPAYAPNLLRLGEATGQFARVAKMIAAQMQRSDKIAKDTRSALTYPLFLVCVGVVAVAFIFYFVVPRFAGMVRGNEEKLPAFTRTIFDLGVSFHENAAVILLLVGLGAIAGLAVSRSASMRPVWDAFLHRVPIIGKLRKNAEHGIWLRVSGLSLQAGARLLDALDLASAAASGTGRAHVYEELQQSVRAGMNLSDAIQLNMDLDPMVVNLVMTGQQAGKLPDMLLAGADIYEERLQSASKQLTELAEPIAILLISAIVGAVVVSLVMAMTSIYDVAL
jgi:general secretion pathway protein F